MVNFPNAKINLGLNITRKREDGYHDIETVFYPLPIHDALEVITDHNTGENVLFSSTGLPVQGSSESNLCVQAYMLLKKDFPKLASVKMHLHKTIPMGAGLGGGSADGAFTLQMLNKKFDLKLSKEQLIGYALKLGSDCPFFIINKPCFATGRGEKLEEINANLSAYKIVIVNPAIHISTKTAFEHVIPTIPRFSIKDIAIQPVQSWKGRLVNDFEEPLFNLYPELQTLKDQLYNTGALYAAMSGSGSTFYGIFEKNAVIQTGDFKNRYFVRIVG